MVIEESVNVSFLYRVDVSDIFSSFYNLITYLFD